MALRRKRSVAMPIYQLKVTLKDSRPPIWRRIQVPGNVTLNMLHEILQSVMGWANYHLWEFSIDGVDYGAPSPEDWYPVEDASKVRLSRVVSGEGAKFLYTYDFGDSWEHQIEVEKVLPPDPNISYPVCIAGKRACPPEDCGGVWGYADLLEIVQDPEHEEYEEMMEWLGGEFDPEALDLEEVNRALDCFRTSPRKRRRRR